MEGVALKNYADKIHYLELTTRVPNDQQLLDALNAFGADGWRPNRPYGEVSLRSLSSWRGGLNLLLEREVEA